MDTNKSNFRCCGSFRAAAARGGMSFVLSLAIASCIIRVNGCCCRRRSVAGWMRDSIVPPKVCPGVVVVVAPPPTPPDDSFIRVAARRNNAISFADTEPRRPYPIPPPAILLLPKAAVAVVVGDVPSWSSFAAVAVVLLPNSFHR